MTFAFRYSWKPGERGAVIGLQAGPWTIGIAAWGGCRGGICVGAWRE